MVQHLNVKIETWTDLMVQHLILLCLFEQGLFRRQLLCLSAGEAVGALEGLRRRLSDPLGRRIDPARDKWHAHCGVGEQPMPAAHCPRPAGPPARRPAGPPA